MTIFFTCINKLLFLLTFISINCSLLKMDTLASDINYTISFEKPHTHYCDVEIKVNNNSAETIFSLPVWTPGSYLVREFAKNVEQVKAFNSKGDSLLIEKISKNSWRAASSGEITLRYKVYANELTV